MKWADTEITLLEEQIEARTCELKVNLRFECKKMF